MKDCQGLPREKQGEHDEISPSVAQEQDFIFIRLNVLREYLTNELRMTNLPFEQDIEVRIPGLHGCLPNVFFFIMQVQQAFICFRHILFTTIIMAQLENSYNSYNKHCPWR